MVDVFQAIFGNSQQCRADDFLTDQPDDQCDRGLRDFPEKVAWWRVFQQRDRDGSQIAGDDRGPQRRRYPTKQGGLRQIGLRPDAARESSEQDIRMQPGDHAENRDARSGNGERRGTGCRISQAPGPSRMMERIGRDKEQAIERWNMRSIRRTPQRLPHLERYTLDCGEDLRIRDNYL